MGVGNPVLVGAEVDTDVLLEVAVVKVDGTLVLAAIQLHALLTLLATSPAHAATAKVGTILVSK